LLNNIKIEYLRDRIGGVDWIGLVPDRNKWKTLVNSVMNLPVPKDAGKLSSGFTTGGLSSSARLNKLS
jgi:hypothetical protein